MENKKNPQISRRAKWGYAIGAIPNALYVIIFSLKYIEFFYDKLLLNPMLFIIGQVIYMTVNALNDPLMGQLTDRTNAEKWGSRRIIYIRYGGPIYGITFLLLWFPWSLDNQIIIFIHYVLSLCLFDTMLSLIALVWMALLPEMTSDLDERNKTAFFAGILGVVTVVPITLFFTDLDPTSAAFQFFVIIIAVVCTVLFFITAQLTEERAEFRKDPGLPLGAALKETLKYKSFLLFMAYNFCDAFMASIGLSYLFAYSFILGEGAQLYYLIIAFGIGFVSNFIMIGLRPKFGMRKIMLTLGPIKVVIQLIVFFISILMDIPLLLLIGFAFTTFFGSYNTFKDPIMYLSMDEDELKHGSRREGMFLGMNALFVKPATSLGPIIATLIFAAFGFVQGSDVQTTEAIIGIKILFLLVPAITVTISLIILYFHPLIRKDTLVEMRKNLEALHAQKKANAN